MKTIIFTAVLLFIVNFTPTALHSPPMSAYSVPVVLRPFDSKRGESLIQTQEAHPYPKDIITIDNKDLSLVRKDVVTCSSGPAVRAVFKHAPEGEEPRFFFAYIISPEDKPREILMEVKEEGIFVQVWVEREEKLGTYDYYASFDDLKAKYPSPCDIVKPKTPTQGT